MLSFSWFCKNFAQNIDKLPSFYPFFKKNCKLSRPDGLNIGVEKFCGILNIYKLINFVCTYISDDLLYLYEFFNSFIQSYLLKIMQSKFNQNGRILFEGVSPLTGQKIVCIITGLKTSTSNEKTGDMLQTWILLQDHKPNEAHKNGLNRGVCGDCVHAGWNQGSCYVKWFQAPLQVWKSYKAGRYDYFNNSDLKLVKNRALRMGSAGDPTMIPLSVWQPLLNVCKSHTGYSHQYRHDFAIDFKNVLQASCDTFDDYLYASDLGFNCFLVKHKDTKAPQGFINCPASIEAGKKTSCELCSMCSGSGSKRGKNIYINAHGNTAKYVPVIA